MAEAMLTVDDVHVHFDLPRPGLGQPRPRLRAVDGVSFELAKGETLGIVGESGCGKSTLARAILGLAPISHGRVRFRDVDLTELGVAERMPYRKAMGVIFQDPLASLNPRMTLGDIIAEPLRTFEPNLTRAERRGRIEEMMDLVGLKRNQINGYPHQFSGGQCQRIGIARALIANPEVLICDEPVSALDVSIQAQIINLLRELQARLGLTLLFIAHDLAVVRHISQRVLVMYLGRTMEILPREQLVRAPAHPYTQALIEAIPQPTPGLTPETPPLADDLPSAINPPSGCRFQGRCPHTEARCREETPPLRALSQGYVACHFAERLQERWRGEAVT